MGCPSTTLRAPFASFAALTSRMVEAAGVEPASEDLSSRDSTCVAASVFSRPTCGCGSKPPGARLSASHDQALSRHPVASLFNGIWPPTTRRGRGRRSLLIRQRERTEYPQLRDIPSDLRVNGARHASRDSWSPSKPKRPHEVCRVDLYCTASLGSLGLGVLGSLGPWVFGSVGLDASV